MKVILMPYHHKIDYIIDIFNQNATYDIVAIVANSAYINILKNDKRCKDNNIEIVENIADITSYYDSVINFSDIIESSAELINQLNIAKLNGKDVISILDNSFSRCRKSNLKLFNIPIITISKTNKRIKTLGFCYQLTNRMKDEGYRVSVISDDSIAEFIGYDAYDKILFDNIDASYKIEQINNYIYEIVDRDNPQILVLDIPSDINDEYVYIVQRAAEGDYNIVLTEAFRCFDSYYAMLETNIRELFYGKVNEIVISNYVLDFIEENCEAGMPIRESSLKKLCGSKSNIFDIAEIYNRIKAHFTNLETI